MSVRVQLDRERLILSRRDGRRVQSRETNKSRSTILQYNVSEQSMIANANVCPFVQQLSLGVCLSLYINRSVQRILFLFLEIVLSFFSVFLLWFSVQSLSFSRVPLDRQYKLQRFKSLYIKLADIFLHVRPSQIDVKFIRDEFLYFVCLL